MMKKKMRSTFSKILISVGVICVLVAVVLFVKNQMLENNAKTYSTDVLEQITEEFSDEVDEDFIEDTKFKAEEADEVLVDGDLYLGVLQFPTLGIELPVQSDWSYDKLRNTPCVYKDEPFSIAAHNYNAHFGRIGSLNIGDQVIFIDVNGIEYIYEVLEVYKVHETEIEALEDASYDLTLFTCNKSNNTERVVVRLEFKSSY